MANERSRAFCPESQQDSASTGDQKATSTDMPKEQHPESHLFTLRIWQENLGESKAEWRGRVQNIATGETLFFRDWTGLAAALLRLVAKTTPACENRDTCQSAQDQNDE